MYREARVGVIRLSDGKEIKPDRSNQEWLDYLAWFKAGGVPLPILPEAPQISVGQDVMWSRIKEERERRKHGGTLVNGYWFHSDEASRVQQLGLVMMGASVPAVPWKTLSGAFVTMSPALAQGIFTATATLDQAAFAVAEGHRSNMLLENDPYSYDFSAGWPTIYGE